MANQKNASPIYIGRTEATPLGRLWIAVSDAGWVAIEDPLPERDFRAALEARFGRPVEADPGRVRPAARQVEEYLAGKRTGFDLPVDWSGLTPFQQAALRATAAIPAGETRTYRQVAESIGHPGAARAVGRAEATNPLPLVLPCHRVVGTDGKLHGYGFGRGLKTKVWLQELEKSRAKN